MRKITTNANGLGSLLLIGSLLLSTPLVAQDLPGTTEWGAKVSLSTTVSGMVSKVHVFIGDEVKQGAVLIELDPRNYQTRLDAAELRRDAARQLNDEAQRELDRSLELYDRTMLAEHERKLAEIETAKAAAALRDAEAELMEVRLQRDYSRIKAPFPGRVLKVHVQPGEAVVNRFEVMPLVTLVDHKRMRAHALVDAGVLTRTKVGDEVKVGVRGVWLDGLIAALGYDPVSRSDGGANYRLEAEFRPPEGMELRSGEKLVIRLPDE